MLTKTSGLRPTAGEFVPKSAATDFEPKPSASKSLPKSTADEPVPESVAGNVEPEPTAGEFVPQTTAGNFEPKPTASGCKPKLTASEFAPKLTASGFVPKSTAGQGVPKPAVSEFMPKSAACNFAPKPTASEFVPKSKACNFKPTASEFVPKASASLGFPEPAANQIAPNSTAWQPAVGGTQPAEDYTRCQQQMQQGARDGAEEACEEGMGKPHSGQPFWVHPYSGQWDGWDESQGWLWGGGEVGWEGWEQGCGPRDEHATAVQQNTAWQAGEWEADGPWWDGGCLMDPCAHHQASPIVSGMGGNRMGWWEGDMAWWDGGYSIGDESMFQMLPLSEMEGADHRPQQRGVDGESCGQGPQAEQAETQVSVGGGWGGISGGGVCQLGRGRGRGRSVGASRGGGSGRGRGRRVGGFVGMARTCEKLEPEQAAELLGMLFPGYCKDAIAALLAANNGRVADCVQELHLIEQETMGGAGGGAPDLGLDGFMGEAHVGVTDHAAPHSFRKPGGRHNGHVALNSESAFPALGSTSNISKIGSNGGGYCSSGVAKEGGGSDGSGQCSGAVARGKETLREESGGSATRKGPWVEAAKQGANKAGGAQQQQQQEQQHKRQQSLLQRLRPLSSSPAPAGQHARASTSAAAKVRALACAQHIPWVETGDAVSKQYADARSEARDWCRLRNHCFQQATLAYCSGNKALAKELSIKGRNAADKMWEAHASAADTILAARNAKHRENRASMYQISCGAHPHFVDLHGLHVQEALALIAEFLEEGTSTPAQGQRGNVLRVCVGTGHHTMGPTANAPRLAAAVVNALKDWGVRFRTLQPGLLEILLW